jgi:hypothetical protein
VEKFEDANNFGGVEACGVFVESFGFAEVGEYFAARAVIKLETVSFVLGTQGYAACHTSIYKESWSEKEVINVVIKGCPATSARTCRSWLT